MPQLPTADPVVLDEAAQRRIRQAMTATPFAASSRVPIPASRPVAGRYDVVDADAVVAFLEGLAGVLTDHAERTHRLTSELDELRQQRTAVRAFLGLGG